MILLRRQAAGQPRDGANISSIAKLDQYLPQQCVRLSGTGGAIICLISSMNVEVLRPYPITH